MSSTDSAPHLDEQGKAELAAIWAFLKRPQDTSDAWPCVCIEKLHADITPQNPDAGSIPICLVNALLFDIRQFPTPLERSEHFAFYIGRSQIESMSEFWKATLHRILSAFANCPRPRTRTGLTSLILDNLFGLHGSEEVTKLGINPTTSKRRIPDQDRDDDASLSISDSETDNHRGRRTYPMDLTQSIRVMTSIFSPSDRLNGEETEPFMHRLQPIVDQMEASQIQEKYQVTTLFSLLTGKAKEVASKVRTHDISVNEFVQELSNDLVFEHNIQQRKMNRWKATTFAEYRAKSQTHHEAVRDCIEFLTSHQKDLTSYHRTDHHLLERLREVFEFEEWCTTLYEQDQPTMSSSAFGNRLLTAASRFDNRRKRPTHSTNPSTYHIAQPPSTSTAPDILTGSNVSHIVAAFFAKTPPPPRHRRPFRFRRYQRYPSWNRNRRPPSALRRSSQRLCYGCSQPGHILRNCPEKSKYTQRLSRLHQAGTGAHLILQQLEAEPSDEIEELVNYVNDYFCEPEDDTAEFDAWICELMDVIEDSTMHIENRTMQQTNQGTFHTSLDAYAVKFSITDLEKAMQEMIHNVEDITQHLLIDPGAPRSICSETWLQNSNWAPVKKLSLPPNIHPFRFAGHPIFPKYAVCLAAALTDLKGNQHIFRQVVFVLPPTPIPFLVGLQIQRHLSFDLCMRQGTDSHLKIQKWQSIHNLVVNTHVWLPFSPTTTDPVPSFDWSTLINMAFSFSGPKHTSLASYTVTFPADNQQPTDPTPASLVNVTLPWEKDDWSSKLNEQNLDHLHKVLRHPQNTAMLNLFRQQNEGRKVPTAIREYIEQQQQHCRPCQAHAELPRVPKLAIPPPATPNIAVSLDVMPHRVRTHTAQILVILDHGDMMLRLHKLEDSSAVAAFNAYLSRWISIFDSPSFTIVDRGSNLANQYMRDNLRTLDSQLCPIPTEAPWSLGRNERSHRFLHKAIDRLVSDTSFEPGHNLIRLLAEVEIAWNCTQHTNRVLPHLHRFGVMPRVLGELENSPSTQERIALMQLLRTETDKLRAEEVLKSAMHSYRRHVQSLRQFSIGQKVWFHRRNFGWRQGSIARLERPNIFVSYKDKLYPTHESRLRPFFGELSLPPEIRANDNEDSVVMDRPAQIAAAGGIGTSPLSAFQASVALQRNNQQKKPTLRTLEDTTRSLLFAKQSQSAELAYTALEEDTIHIRLYTDGSFQNLETKHSQIGFVIGIADRHDSFNLVHWHSSRAPRRPCSTEQSELLALDIGLRSLENIRTIIFGLLKREVPVVTYIDCQTLWSNLMNETVPTIPEVGYRYREHITEGKVSSVCLIPSDSNPADALTKAKPNKQLARTLSSNHCCTPAKKVFMLQDSPHRHLTWIPTMRVPMPDDSKDGMGNHCNNCTE